MLIPPFFLIACLHFRRAANKCNCETGGPSLSTYEGRPCIFSSRYSKFQVIFSMNKKINMTFYFVQDVRSQICPSRIARTFFRPWRLGRRRQLRPGGRTWRRRRRQAAAVRSAVGAPAAAAAAPRLDSQRCPSGLPCSLGPAARAWPGSAAIYAMNDLTLHLTLQTCFRPSGPD